MGKIQTTQEFKNKIHEKYNGKVEIIGEYLGVSHPIAFIYYCDKHGEMHGSMNAKNISSNKSFQPCKECETENKKGNRPKSQQQRYDEFKAYVESKGGFLLDKEWVKSKHLYTIKCNDESHPVFKMTHDSIMGGKKAWCPWCYGRFGKFDDEISEIIKSKNGELLSEYESTYRHVKVKCLTHNHVWEIMPLNIKKGRWCYVCKMNISEKAVWDYFTNNNYKFGIQHTFKDLKTNGQSLRYDFVILNEDSSIKYLIEVDDSEHWGNHKSERRKKSKERESLKDKYCKDKNISIFRMIYNDRDDKFKDYDFYYNYLSKQIVNFEKKL